MYVYPLRGSRPIRLADANANAVHPQAQRQHITPHLYPQEYRFYKSLQQTVLSRAFARFAVESAAARRLLLHLAISQAPDEIFFPTLLHLPEAAPHLERCVLCILRSIHHTRYMECVCAFLCSVVLYVTGSPRRSFPLPPRFTPPHHPTATVPLATARSTSPTGSARGGRGTRST